MSRIERFCNQLPIGIDAAIIQSDENRYYLTGFNSSAGIIFATREKAYLIIDFRYIEAARASVSDIDVVLLEDSIDQIKRLIKKHAVKTIGVECDRMNLYEFARLKKCIPECAFDDSDAVTCVIENMRMIKDKTEIAFIKEAQRLTDDAFSYILNFINLNRTEKEIALELEYYLRKNGADGAGFNFVVVSGTNTSKPHGVPSDKKIHSGDFITMDFGACINGYRSDMTRTVAVTSVSEEQKRIYDITLQAQLVALDTIKAGLRGCDVDKVARDIIYSQGYSGCFGHGLGHSVGIEIHESPSLSPRCERILEPGIVMTVEPGIYLSEKFGVRIEDMVIIEEKGCENLTKSEKTLIIL